MAVGVLGALDVKRRVAHQRDVARLHMLTVPAPHLPDRILDQGQPGRVPVAEGRDVQVEDGGVDAGGFDLQERVRLRIAGQEAERHSGCRDAALLRFVGQPLQGFRHVGARARAESLGEGRFEVLRVEGEESRRGGIDLGFVDLMEAEDVPQ